MTTGETPEKKIGGTLDDGTTRVNIKNLKLPEDLKKEFEKEKKDTIAYFTKKELNKYRDLLGDGDKKNELEEFLNQQMEETQTLGEILTLSGAKKGKDKESQEILEEVSEKVSDVLYEVLFGKSGLLNEVGDNLSEDAKRNVCVGFGLAILNKIGESEKSIVDFFKYPQQSAIAMKNWLTENSKTIDGIIQKIRDDFEKTIDIANSGITQQNTTEETDTEIQDLSEEKTLFMDPLKSRDYFIKKFDGENTDSIIKNGENDEEIKKEGQKQIKQDMQKLNDLVQKVMEVTGNETIDGLINYIKKENFPAIQEAFLDSIDEIKKIFKKTNVGDILDKVGEQFDGEKKGTLMNKFLNWLESLFGEDKEEKNKSKTNEGNKDEGNKSIFGRIIDSVKGGNQAGTEEEDDTQIGN